MQRNKFLGVAVSAGLAVTVLGACGGGSGKASSGGILGTASPSATTASPTTAKSGGSSSDATGNVTAAVKKVGDSSGVQLEVSLEGSASSFPAGSGATPAQINAILNSKLIIATHTSDGKSLSASASTAGGSQGDFQIALVSGGANLGTFEIIDSKTLYARVDINKTASTYGLNAGSAAKAQQTLQQASTEVPGLDALEAGQWVSVDLTPLLQLEKRSAATSTTTAGGGFTPASEQQLVAAFLKAVEQNSQITNLGSANGGTKFQAVVREKALVQSLSQAAQTIPGLGSKAAGLNADNISATQTVTVDVTLKDGVLTELQLPLNQFDTTHKLTGPVTLDLGISGSPAIAAPAGAKAVDLSPLLSELGASSSSSSASASSTVAP